MTSVFLFALILGGGLLLVSLLGDIVGGGGDLDVDLDVDLDADATLDGGAAAEPAAGAGGAHASDADVAGAFRIFTIRNLTYFLFGFGALGTALTWLDAALAPWLTVLLSVGAGAVAAAAAAVAFGWLRRTESGARPDESSFIGCEGRITLALGHGRVGQVMVRRGVREFEVRALPFDGRAAQPERWRRVVVVDMRGGTALVSPMEELTPAGSDPTSSSDESS